MGLRTVQVCQLWLVCVLSACNAPDPGVEGLTRGEFSDSGIIAMDAPSDSPVKTDSAVPTDGSVADVLSDAPLSTTAFTGAGAYAGNKPATSAATTHNNDKVGITPGKGVDCLSCHKMGGAGPMFLFAGTIFQDQNGTTPAVDEEVRVRGTDGKAFSAYSDDDGNFWYLPQVNDALAFPIQAGARDATNMALMTNTQTAGSCNAAGCHDGTTQAFIHVP